MKEEEEDKKEEGAKMRSGKKSFEISASFP